MVDAGVVMQYLEQRDPQAARSLMEYHRRAEFMKNPVPECIRNTGYSILTWNSPYEPQEISEENLNETFGA